MNELNVVIAELNFIVALIAANPKDRRIKATLKQAQLDLAKAARKVGGDDPGVSDKN